jgi:phage terminase small subunit
MSPKPTIPKPPKHLGRNGKAFYAATTAEFVLESDHHCRQLEAAAAFLDRIAAAREEIAKHGLLMPDRFGVMKENPALAVERASANSFRLLVRELGLDIEPPSEHRGPRRPGSRN